MKNKTIEDRDMLFYSQSKSKQTFCFVFVFPFGQIIHNGWFLPNPSVGYLGGQFSGSFCEYRFCLAYQNYFTSFISSFSCLKVYGAPAGHKQASRLSWVIRAACLIQWQFEAEPLNGKQGCCVQGADVYNIVDTFVM